MTFEQIENPHEFSNALAPSSTADASLLSGSFSDDDVVVVRLITRGMPAAAVRALVERLLNNLAENCSDRPDLVQFWPAEKSYRMVEVKGPGDRLQDNQLRWIAFRAQHQISVAVCHVRWAEAL